MVFLVVMRSATLFVRQGVSLLETAARFDMVVSWYLENLLVVVDASSSRRKESFQVESPYVIVLGIPSF